MNHIKSPIIFLLFALLALTGCGDFDFDPNSIGSGFPTDNQDAAETPADAETALRNHDLSQARRIYARRLDENPNDGQAAAGLGLLDTLLIPGMPELSEILIHDLGAARRLNASEVIYGDGGYLYWASRGATWEDDGDYQGIRQLLADDLPWSAPRLENLTAFVHGLNEPVDKTARKLVTLANVLQGLDLLFQTAINDPDFVRFYLPGEVLHDPDLTLILGRSELSMLRANIALLRASIYFFAAYEHPWNLEEAFGPWRFDVPLDNRNYVPGFQPRDYTVAYLDQHLFRRIAYPERLSAAQSALRLGFTSYRDAIRFGLEEPSSTTLTWEAFSIDEARVFDDYFSVLIDALDGPAQFRHVPNLTLDLSSFFTQGRTLPEGLSWFVQTSEITEPDEEDKNLEIQEHIHWDLSPDALEAFFYQHVLSPLPPEDDLPHILFPHPDGLPGFFDPILGDYLERFNDVYFTTR